MNHEVPPIPSATLMLVSGEQDKFEVLMVERNVEIEFAGGAFVFPGGKISPADSTLAYPEHSDLASAKIAAIRETFEETGILLALDENLEPVFEKHKSELVLRLGIEKDPKLFTQFLATNGYTPALDILYPYAIWVTPKIYKKRFATWFFIAEVPQKYSPLTDGKEAVSAQWIRPVNALLDNENGRKIMMFPTICNLKMLDRYRELNQIVAVANSRSTPIIDPIPLKINGNWEITLDPKYGYPSD
jgi:8-oxo-dGTP pyrophosphatase MutT (NUDIX family)